MKDPDCGAGAECCESAPPGDEGGSFLTMTFGALPPFCDEGDICFFSEGEFLVPGPS